MNIEPVDVETLEKEEVSGVTFTAADRAILAAMEPVVDAVATLFGSHCEVLLHSLENLNHSIVKIRNGQVTGRGVGSPITDLGIKVLKDTGHIENDIVGSYLSNTEDGKTLKSITALIRNGTKPVGMLCINVDLSVPLLEVLKSLLPETLGTPRDESPEHFVMSAEDLVRRSLDKAIIQVSANREISHQLKNKAIVTELHGQGIFDIKGAVEIVAKELAISRYTVYNYIRDARM